MATNFKSCAVAGCNRNAHRDEHGKRGWCSRHYQRWLRNGDPQGITAIQGEPMRFVMETALLYEGDDCLTWPYGTDSNGYGVIFDPVEKKSVRVSHMVCRKKHGYAPADQKYEAAHSCGKGHEGCVSSRHLSWKTLSENQMDRVAHGTSSRGERNGSAKLTEAEVREIRALRGQKIQLQIADMYGVCPTAVHDIQARKTWGWLA